MKGSIYQSILKHQEESSPSLAVLIDPEEFDPNATLSYLQRLPSHTTHLLVGGSTANGEQCEETIRSLKLHTSLPIVIFPGNHEQISGQADALLFLSLLSGRNPEYLIGQQIQAVPRLTNMNLEVIPTAYLLIDGGADTAVARVSKTEPMSQEDVAAIVNTAMAGVYMGAKLVYLEAGSGAAYPVNRKIVRALRKATDLPIIVGGGIKSHEQEEELREAGADMIVMGTAFEANRKAANSQSEKTILR